MNFLGIVPARYASTRFPGKPLADIGGKTMIQRVYEQASQCLTHVVVATDDERIRQAVLSFGGEVVMTSPDHRSGTDRCAEALERYENQTGHTYDVVINIQGDEPFIRPEQLRQAMECFADETCQIATLVKQGASNDDIFNPNKVKVALTRQGFALYFSRSPIPYLRGTDTKFWADNHAFNLHIGLYAYRTQALREITRLAPSSLEIAESLEQNRWLENGYRIRAALTEYESIGIDTPEDLQRVLGGVKN